MSCDAVDRMLYDTHKRVLMNPMEAIANLANEKTEEMACNDDLMDQFQGNTHGIYEMAVDAPDKFVATLTAYMNGDYEYESIAAVRSWVTLAYMNQWRNDLNAHNGRSKEFYRMWLQSELKSLQAVEAQAAAVREAEPSGPPPAS